MFFIKDVKLVAASDLVGANDDGPACNNAPSLAVESAESLAQGVNTRALAHHRVKIEIRPNFQALSSNDEHRSRLIARLAGLTDARLNRLCQFVPVERTHPTDRKVEIGFGIPLFSKQFGQPRVNFSGSGHAVDHDSNRLSSIRLKLDRADGKRFSQFVNRLFPLCPFRDLQLNRLGRIVASHQYWMATIVVVEVKGIAGVVAKRCARFAQL